MFDVQPIQTFHDASGPDAAISDAQGDPYREAVLADGPAAYFRLADEVPVDAVDEVNAVPCSYFGKFTLDREGSVASGNPAIAFGDPMRHVGGVNCGDRFDFEGRAEFSLEVWMKGEYTGDYKTLLGKYQNPPVAAGYKIHLLYNTLTFARGSNGSDQTLAPYDLPMVGVWTHIVATYDGNMMTLYVDGVLQRMIPSAVSIPASSTELLIGAENGAANPTTPFYGSLDEVAIYKHALTAAQVRNHFVAAAIGP